MTCRQSNRQHIVRRRSLDQEKPHRPDRTASFPPAASGRPPFLWDANGLTGRRSGRVGNGEWTCDRLREDSVNPASESGWTPGSWDKNARVAWPGDSIGCSSDDISLGGLLKHDPAWPTKRRPGRKAERARPDRWASSARRETASASCGHRPPADGAATDACLARDDNQRVRLLVAFRETDLPGRGGERPQSGFAMPLPASAERRDT
jgi:hypothetical protein